MTPQEFQRVADVFRDACRRTPAERTEFIADACADEPVVRAEVERLLAADAALPDSDSDSVAVGDAAAGSSARRATPERVGRYRILRAIGTGGMGTVFEAVQDEPRRRVALKLIRGGIASPSALRRFQFEAQILARLHHPGVAQIYEAGTHDDGVSIVPYFAMEYLAGAKPITAYAREKKLGLRERLELMAEVCDAVQHGHQKGIIHRDLKPDNLLVDSAGRVKVIDFGVARATDSDMAVTTLQTGAGQLLGTLPYMSPEQLGGDPEDLDVRADAYALGVVLFELLCDRLPYDVEGKPILEAARIVREHEPVRPSAVTRSLRGDLEAISLKTLAKDREKRYESAGALGADLRRHLAGTPVEARPYSTWYVLEKHARRHWKALTIAAVFVAIVSVFAVTVLELGRQLRESEDARQLDASLRPYLASNPASVPQGKLNEAFALLRQGEIEPPIRARLSTTIGKLYYMNGEFDRAETLLNDALGLVSEVDDLELAAEIYQALGRARYAKAEFETARARFDTVRQIRECQLSDGLNDLASLHRKEGRLADSEALHLRALELRETLMMQWRGGPLESKARFRLAASQNNLAVCRRDQWRLDEAAALFERVLETTGATRPRYIARTKRSLAACRLLAGDIAEAETLTEEARAITVDDPGEDHPDMAKNYVLMARCRLAAGRPDEAVDLCRAALAIQERAYSGPHTSVAETNGLLGRALLEGGRSREAAPVLWAAHEVGRSLLGPGHPDRGESLHDLARLHLEQGDAAEAERLVREALVIRATALGETHPDLAETIGLLGRIRDKRGDPVEAEKRLREAVTRLDAVLGPDHWRRRRARATLAAFLDARGRGDEAAAVAGEAG